MARVTNLIDRIKKIRTIVNVVNSALNAVVTTLDSDGNGRVDVFEKKSDASNE